MSKLMRQASQPQEEAREDCCMGIDREESGTSDTVETMQNREKDLFGLVLCEIMDSKLTENMKISDISKSVIDYSWISMKLEKYHVRL